MERFISDCKVALRMLGSKVHDEDNNLLTFWEKGYSEFRVEST